MKTVIATGAYGHGNAGDDLLAETVRHLVAHAGLHVRLATGSLGAFDGDLTQSRPRLIRALRTADLLLFGGGGLFNDHWSTGYLRYFASLATAARALGVPVATAGVGIETPSTTRGRLLLHAVSRVSSTMGVRDEHSAALARRHGARHVVLGTDLAWAHPLKPAEPGRTRDALILSFAGEVEAKAAGRLNMVIAALDQLQRMTDVNRLVLVSTSVSEGDPLHNDVTWLAEIARRLSGRWKVEIREARCPQDLVDASADGVAALGFRLHSLITAYMNGMPVVALSRSPKVAHTFAQAPNSAIFNADEASPHQVAEATARFLAPGASNSAQEDFLAARRDQVFQHMNHVLKASA